MSLVAAAHVPTDSRPERQPVGDLDWLAYQARFFPGKRPRHDFKAVVAYGAYRLDGHETPDLVGRDGDSGNRPIRSVVVHG